APLGVHRGVLDAVAARYWDVLAARSAVA
ncbi:MAG: hypothetical protein QOD96_1097, partial [Pseudonocardiales bacterium]|nr:hypothetical protein [Pseudonocardiales bacterium]